MTTKAKLHQLVDELPGSELDAAARFLAYLRDMADPFERMLNEAPEDDEPTTPEEDQTADEAWEEYRRGEYISAEQAKHELLG